MENIFATLRLGVFGVILLFSLITLGLAANLTTKTIGWTFPGFSVAVSILTMVIAIPMLVVDRLRKGSFVSWVATELGWCGLLWILWLSSSGLSTSTVFFTGDCAAWADVPEFETICQQYSALQAFSWLTWLLFTGYIISVIVLSILATVKGNSRVWLNPASDLSFSPQQTHSGEPKNPSANYSPNYGGTPGAYPPGQQPVGYNPTSNYAGTPVVSGGQYNQFAQPAQTNFVGQV
jgi:hypothetical protein